MTTTHIKPTFSEEDITLILQKTGGDVVKAQSEMKRLVALRKDSMPPEGRPGPEEGRLYQNGPFGYIDKEITSAVVTGGSPLMNWIPTSGVKSRYERVSHLEWIGAKGFDSTETTYPEWLNSIEIGECGYGPTTTWSGFTWQASGGTFSWKTDMMKMYEDSGIKYHEQQPTYTFRNAQGVLANGNPLESDKDWAIARVLFAMETHLDYILKHGDEKNSQMEWDGIDQILRPGYVQARVQGSGVAHWADPLYVNGAGLTVAQLFQTIRVVVRRLRRRAQDRNWQISPTDMVILMPHTMWDNLAEYVAAGALYAYTNTFGFSGDMSIDVYDRRYDSIRTGGALGFGSIKIDGFEIPVMTDPNLGVNTTITDGGVTTSAISGDIYILTRRASGMTLWEQQYVDWNMLDYPNWNEDRFTLQNGLVRAGWVTEANKCYFYFAEMGGRLVCRMLPLQGRITNVTVSTLDNLENEAGAFYHPDFWASRELGGLTGVDSGV